MADNRFRLRNMNITRVDLVDRGANQDAYIMLAKADTMEKEKKDEKKPAEKPAGGGDVGSEKGAVRVRGELAQRITQMLAERDGGEDGGMDGEPGAPADSPASARTPLSRNKGDGSRLIGLRPSDFDVVSADGNMMVWAIPEESLPDGVEAAEMTMVQSGDTVMFQWMIDPLAGPPVEGTSKTAPEAFLAMRSALTQSSAMDPMQALGGLPTEMKPGMQPGMQQPSMPKPGMAKPGASQPAAKPASKPQTPGAPALQQDPMKRKQQVAKSLTDVEAFSKRNAKIRRALKALAAAKRRNKSRMAHGQKPIVQGKEVSPSSLSKADTDKLVSSVLDIITKGLVEVDVFVDDATGDDLRDILPTNLLSKLTDELSATRAPR